MDDAHLLRQILARNGFKEAAVRLELPSRHAAAAIATWQNYPCCMDQYPNMITGRKAVI